MCKSHHITLSNPQASEERHYYIDGNVMQMDQFMNQDAIMINNDRDVNNENDLIETDDKDSTYLSDNLSSHQPESE
jgi:hypothetical protein